MLALPEVCSWLLDCGCEVDMNSGFGRPLHCALTGDRVLEGPSHEGDWYSFFTEDQDPIIGSTHQESTIRVILELVLTPIITTISMTAEFHLSIWLRFTKTEPCTES